MNRIFLIIVAMMFTVGAVMITRDIIVAWTAVDGAKPLDPRAPPRGVQPGDYSHQTQHTETWTSHPADARGTEAARFEQRPISGSGGKEASALSRIGSRLKEELFDYGKAPDPGPRTGPPAPCTVDERAPYWYEKEGIYNEPDYPEPEPERSGLFSRLRARRDGR